MTGYRPDSDRFARFFARVSAGEDGSKEGGLVFLIVLMGGMVFAATVIPGSLTSFFVWFALLMLAISAGLGTQRLVQWLFHSDGNGVELNPKTKGPRQ